METVILIAVCSFVVLYIVETLREYISFRKDKDRRESEEDNQTL